MRDNEPFNWKTPTTPANQPEPDSNGAGNGFRAMLLRVGLVLAFALFLTSHLPPPLIAATASSLLLIAACVSAVAAWLLGERPRGRRLTRWDEAAALMGMSLLLGFAVDPQAAALAVEALQAGAV